MIYLLNWRLWVLGALLALGPIGYLKGRVDGKHAERLVSLAAQAEANSEATRLERARQSAADDAARLAAARTNRILADAASARSESDGLRDDLNAAKQYAKKSRDAAERTAELASDLLGRCESKYLGVAESAARADSYARQLMDAWPK